jgi:cytochrome c-type biogenesis protein CcmE
VSRRRSPARLVIALSVAALLAVFLLYTSIAGGGTPQLRPSELQGRDGRVSLVGKVVGPVANRDHARERGMRFRLRDVEGAASVPVVYRGSVPDLFKVGRDVVLQGELRRGVFVADGLATKCPSKYKAKRSAKT